MSEPLNTLFPNDTARLRELRRTDAEFDEICTHLEILLRPVEARLGKLNPETTDLIASFDELRREIERQLTVATGAKPRSQTSTAHASAV